MGGRIPKCRPPNTPGPLYYRSYGKDAAAICNGGVPDGNGSGWLWAFKVTVATFAEAEKLVQAPLSAKDQTEVASNWRQATAPVYERRVGPGKLIPRNDEVPTTVWDPTLGVHAGPTSAVFVRSTGYEAALLKDDAAIACATVAQLPDGSR